MTMTPKTYKRLLCMGNPLLDITANVNKEFLEKYELKANSAILADEKHDGLYEDMTKNFKVDYVTGGAAQNTVRIAQWFLPAGSTSFIGCVGKDDYSEKMQSISAKTGVDTNYMVDEKTPTGTCAVLITNQNRSMVAKLSAANNYNISHLEQPKNWSYVVAADLVYISGFFLTVSPDTMIKVGQYCAENEDKIFCMNLSAPFLCEFFKDKMLSVLPFCDIVVCNEMEAKAFAIHNNFDTEDLPEIALKLCNFEKVNAKRDRMVIFTQGSEKTIIAHKGKVIEYEVPKVDEKDIVDTNGCGDAFLGGFLASLMKGCDLKKCVDTGHYAAQKVLMQSGCVTVGNPDEQYC